MCPPPSYARHSLSDVKTGGIPCGPRQTSSTRAEQTNRVADSGRLTGLSWFALPSCNTAAVPIYGPVLSVPERPHGSQASLFEGRAQPQTGPRTKRRAVRQIGDGCGTGVGSASLSRGMAPWVRPPGVTRGSGSSNTFASGPRGRPQAQRRQGEAVCYPRKSTLHASPASK